MQHYVLGFAVNPAGTHLLLLQKARPAWATGQWNGVGGKVEADETPLQAMVREFAEETGLVWPAEAWSEIGQLGDGVHYQIVVFAAQGDIKAARTLTDEPVAVYAQEAVASLPLAPDLDACLGRLRAGGWLGDLASPGASA